MDSTGFTSETVINYYKNNFRVTNIREIGEYEVDAIVKIKDASGNVIATTKKVSKIYIAAENISSLIIVNYDSITKSIIAGVKDNKAQFEIVYFNDNNGVKGTVCDVVPESSGKYFAEVRITNSVNYYGVKTISYEIV
jgi:hypothetical protein